MNQNEEILDYLKVHKTINPQEALRKFSCMRLASRISDIKKKYGAIIEKHMEKGINAQGKECKYAVYTLVEIGDQK